MSTKKVNPFPRKAIQKAPSAAKKHERIGKKNFAREFKYKLEFLGIGSRLEEAQEQAKTYQRIIDLFSIPRPANSIMEYIEENALVSQSCSQFMKAAAGASSIHRSLSYAINEFFKKDYIRLYRIDLGLGAIEFFLHQKMDSADGLKQLVDEFLTEVTVAISEENYDTKAAHSIVNLLSTLPSVRGVLEKVDKIVKDGPHLN